MECLLLMPPTLPPSDAHYAEVEWSQERLGYRGDLLRKLSSGHHDNANGSVAVLQRPRMNSQLQRYGCAREWTTKGQM